MAAVTCTDYFAEIELHVLHISKCVCVSCCRYFCVMYCVCTGWCCGLMYVVSCLVVAGLLWTVGDSEV